MAVREEQIILKTRVSGILISPSTPITKFKPVDIKQWMFSILCYDFWAKCCNLISHTKLSRKVFDSNILPLLTLSTFIIEQSASLFGHSYPENPTIQMLYCLSKELVELQTEKEQGLVDIEDVVCSSNEKMLHKIEDSLVNTQNITKAKKIIT
ncbi:unnamed protein product [Cunninghamella echinulata]